jgi:multicomponent Na+:H+ antiporter subunit G
VNATLDVVSAALVIVGALLGLSGAIGLHRLTDTLSRMHAATKPATLGVVCCGLGAALQLRDAAAIVLVTIAVGLQLLTAPVGAHLLARSIREHVGDDAAPSADGASEHG